MPNKIPAPSVLPETLPQTLSATRMTRRRAGVAVLALGLSATLAACGSSSSGSSSATPQASESAASSSTPSAATSASASAAATPTVKATVIKNLDAITVTPTTFGKAPKVTGKWPLTIASTQVKVLQQGTGPTVAADGTVEVNYYGVDARTGKVFDQSFSRGQTATFGLGQVVAGFKKALQGQKVGSRVVVMMTGADGYDSAGGNSSAGINVGDSLIFVIDVVSTPYTKATGTAVAPKAGLPVVKDDAKGVPSVTIPKTTAPTTLVVQPLIKGAGTKKVAATDAVTVHYRAWNWANGKLLQDDYSTAGGETGTLANLVPAWKKALVGQTIGSRVLIVAPPSEAYGATATGPIPANTTLVYVVDVLYAAAPATS